MGAFYGSIHVRTTDADSVSGAIARLAKRQQRFLVSPLDGGWVSVYPNDHGQDDRVSKGLAKRLAAPILHLAVHDDDVFFYWYYRNRKLTDRYCSCPDYFEPMSARMKSLVRGKPERLADLLDGIQDVQRLQELLDEMRAEPLFGTDTPERFAKLFGIRHALTSYEYLMAGETEEIERWDEFIHVPDLSEEQQRQQEAEAKLQREKESLKEQGVLLTELSAGQTSHHPFARMLWCPDPSNGVVIFLSATTAAEARIVSRISPPWTDNPSPTGIVLEPQAIAMQASPTGRYLAVAYSGGLRRADLWDVQKQEIVQQIEHTGVWSVAFSPDERLLFTVSASEIIATEIDGRERLTWAVKEGSSIDMHPSGRLFAVRKRASVSIVSTHSGEERCFRMGRHEDFKWLRDMLQTQIRQEIERAGPDWASQQLQSAMKALGVSAWSGDADEMRAQLEQSMNDALSGIAFQHLGNRSFQAEQVHCVRFAKHGEFLCCGTSEGVRVFPTERVLAEARADGSELEPLFSADGALVPIEGGFISGHIYAVVEDSPRNRLLFGGLEGVLRSLDLTTGESNMLVEIPGRPALFRAEWVEDSRLCCLCGPSRSDIERDPPPPFLQIWDVRRLPLESRSSSEPVQNG